MCLSSKFSSKLLLIVFALIVTLKTTEAQNPSTGNGFSSYWQIQAEGGSSLFFGDIKQYQWWPVNNYENEWRFALGIQLNKQISPVFGIRGQGIYGQLAGTRRQWNKHFKNDYFDFNTNATININNIFAPYRHYRFLNAYLIIGIGLTNYNTKVYELGTNKEIQSVGNGNGRSFGGRTLEGILLGGVGLDFRLSEKWNLKLESANRFMNSDMLDGHISGYKYDIYNLTTLGLAFKFGKSKKYHETNLQEEQNYIYDPYGGESANNGDYQYGNDSLYYPPSYFDNLHKTNTVYVHDTVYIFDTVYIAVTPKLEYRVQIRAKYAKALSISYLSKLYSIPKEQIKEDTHNGYYIYSIGSFNTYGDAREKRNQVRANGIPDAFVVAFRDGKRLDKLP